MFDPLVEDHTALIWSIELDGLFYPQVCVNSIELTQAIDVASGVNNLTEMLSQPKPVIQIQQNLNSAKWELLVDRDQHTIADTELYVKACYDLATCTSDYLLGHLHMVDERTRVPETAGVVNQAPFFEDTLLTNLKVKAGLSKVQVYPFPEIGDLDGDTVIVE